MPVTNYYSVGGEILGEETGGVRRDYLTDALGSVTGTVTSAGAIENTYRYKPYGAQLSKTGSGSDPAFTWVGKWGYRLQSSITYIRYRHYVPFVSSFISLNVFKYMDMYYGYSSGNPVTFIDYSGQIPDHKIPKNCDIMKKVSPKGYNSYDVMFDCEQKLYNVVERSKLERKRSNRIDTLTKILAKSIKYAGISDIRLDNGTQCIIDWFDNKDNSITCVPFSGDGSGISGSCTRYYKDTIECRPDMKPIYPVAACSYLVPQGRASITWQPYSRSDIYICTWWYKEWLQQGCLTNQDCLCASQFIPHELGHSCFGLVLTRKDVLEEEEKINLFVKNLMSQLGCIFEPGCL